MEELVLALYVTCAEVKRHNVASQQRDRLLRVASKRGATRCGTDVCEAATTGRCGRRISRISGFQCHCMCLVATLNSAICQRVHWDAGHKAV